MPRILIAGCGYVGQATADLFHAAGWDAEGWTAAAQRDGSWVTEESETKPARDTGRVLLETEKAMLDRGGTVARLSGIYGPGRSALLSKFLAGTAIIDPESDRFVNQVHRDDIASALFLLVTGELQERQIYNVVDNQPMLQSDCYRWLAQRLNRPLPPFRELTGQRKRGDTNKRVSNAKLRSLGWTLQYAKFAEGMEKSILTGLSEFDVPLSPKC